MGCGTFCCRLIVRLEPGELDPSGSGDQRKHCVDKDPRSGLCIHLDPETYSCRVWARRPRLCRDYDCNSDPLLQVVLEQGFVDLATLVRARLPATAEVRRVPYCHPEETP